MLLQLTKLDILNPGCYPLGGWWKLRHRQPGACDGTSHSKPPLRL